LDVQQNGLNFIYDMQNCSASQFDMNLSKKILKLLQVNSKEVPQKDLLFEQRFAFSFSGRLSSNGKKYLYHFSSQMVQNSL